MPKPLKGGRLRTPTQAVLAWICGPGREAAVTLALRTAHQIRRNMVPRRVFSFPHFLFLFWMVILLWGERWLFDSKVQKCDWGKWEKWVSLVLKTGCGERCFSWMMGSLRVMSPKKYTKRTIR